MVAGIANPTLKVNGTTVAIVPNSLSYKLGTGDKVQRPMSSGGNSVTIVTTDNAETKMSMCKFSVPNTPAGLALTRDTADNNEQNTIEIAEPNLQVAFTQMALTTEPERPLTQDGVIELEFMGPPATESA